MNQIICNQAECLKCGDRIISVSTHDFARCTCGNLAVEGGKEYLRRIGEEGTWREMTVFATPEDPHDDCDAYEYSTEEYDPIASEEDDRFEAITEGLLQ